MRIAIATERNRVSHHFGRCPEYTVIDMEDGKVINRHLLKNPGHRPNFLPQFLHDHQIDRIISGGMGQKARVLFDQFSIEPLVGVEGEIETVIAALLNDEIENGKNLCHPEPNHSCNEH